jgi:3-deoxy-manno-octulosonate cytidylyltransferase (CMP-KDO synthetase)
LSGYHVVIPARFASQRLPGKPLASIGGEPMIVRVAQRVALTSAASITVATDDERVAKVVRDAGFEAMLTSATHPSGSDRVMEVVRARGLGDDEVVINVQGDEPLIPPQVVDQLAEAMVAHPRFEVGTLAEPIGPEIDPDDPSVVKVVRSAAGRALYFSRARIPHPRDGAPGGGQWARHVGIYAFRVRALRRFVALAESRLERLERLEQLRLLENDIDILVLEACAPVPGGVDTPADLARVDALFG